MADNQNRIRPLQILTGEPAGVWEPDGCALPAGTAPDHGADNPSADPLPVAE